MAEGNPSSSSHKGHIQDVRGRKVAQLDPVTMRLLHKHDVIPAETLRTLSEEIDPGEIRKRQKGLILGVSGAIVAYILLFFYFRFLARGSWRDPVMFMFYAGYLVVPPVVVYMKFRRARRARHERIRRIMLKHLRCPHCGYDIRGLPTDAKDGATICPECGVAWRLEDSQAVERRGNVVSDEPSTGSTSGSEVDNDG